MAKVNPNNERSEREYRSDVNQAVADTEGEIFDDALGTEPLDKDGDTSLEEMGEGLEGEDLEEEDDEDEPEEEAKEAAKEGDSEEEAEETDEDGEQDEAEDEAEEEPPRDERGRFQEQERPDQREIPLRAERDRRRQAEERAAETDRKLAEALGRIDELSRRANAPPPPPVEQPRPRPDIFADPEGHDQWLRNELKRENDEYVQQQIGAFRQEQQQILNARFDQSLAEASQGDRSEEVDVAWSRLKSLDPNNPSHRATVVGIFHAPDPAAALFKWWDRNGGTQYRASDEYQNRIQDKLDRAEQEAERFRSLLPGRQNSRQRSQQPRHVTQLPDSVRRQPPSLNSARGGQRHEIPDPEMMDDSDDAVFRFAARR